MDYIDLYIYHMWEDYHTLMGETMEGLHNAVKRGKTRYMHVQLLSLMEHI